MTEAPAVVDNAERSRFEVYAGAELAGFVEYRDGDEAVEFTHTEIDPRMEGRGLGSALVRGALEAMRERGKSVVPHCWFVRDWIGTHPEYRDLVPEHTRPQFGL